MDDYIRRGAAIEATCSDCTERNICGGSCSDTDRLRAIPAADVVEVVWKPLDGYDERYEVSNFGEVREKNGNLLHQTVRQKPNTSYKTVWLKRQGKGHDVYVHRLVATAFVENPKPEEYTIVNHKDEDGTNNRADNLEWCTNQYNLTYGTALKRLSAKMRGRTMSDEQKRDISASVKAYQNSEEGAGKRVVCLETGEEFTSIRAAAEHYGLNPSTVGMCCLRRTIGRKYTFRYCADGKRKDGGQEE